MLYQHWCDSPLLCIVRFRELYYGNGTALHLHRQIVGKKDVGESRNCIRELAKNEPAVFVIRQEKNVLGYD